MLSTAPGATGSGMSDPAQAFVPNAYVGCLLVPNTAYPAKVYRIRSNDATTITVDGAINPNYTGPGRTYAIRYGRLVNLQVPTPEGVERSVRFFNAAGPASFASSSAVPDGICQVCHTRTASFTNSGALEGPGHPAAKAGTNCTTCHKHAAGFKADCLNCHGAPPLTAVPGPGGLASYAAGTPGTGSTTPGAHGRHAQSLGYPCETCHSGYTMPDDTDRIVDIGFSVFSRSGGSYDGQAAVAYAGHDGTVVSRNGSKTCSNISCHGGAMAPNNGFDTTPVWDGPATGGCGACHGATATTPPLRGSHTKHSRTDLIGYAYPCQYCHRDPATDATLHVNNSSEVVFSADPKTAGGAYSGTPAMLDAYGACTNVYCHSTVQSSPPGGAVTYRTTPAWGQNDSLDCANCHSYAGSNPPLATGSHAKHFEYAGSRDCTPCHNYNAVDDPCRSCHDPGTFEPQRDRHADRRVDLTFNPRYGGSYSGSPEPGDAYGSCSTTYCHGNYPGSGGQATPSWGSAATGACGTCHGGSNTAAPNSGAHLRHADQGYHNYPCTFCHAGVVGGAGPAGYTVLDREKHANGVVDWAFDSTDSRVTASSAYSIPSGTYSPSDGVTPRLYGKCSNLYCHSIAQTATGGPLTGAAGEYAVTPFWSASGGSSFCGLCHRNGSTRHNNGNPGPMNSGSHTTHLAYQFNARNNEGTYKCAICHHYEEQLAGTYNSCNACHSTSAVYIRHANGTMDVVIDEAFGVAGYNDTSPVPGAPGNGFFTCSNTYCHSTGVSVATGSVPPNVSAVWGSSIAACGACHGSPPAYANGSPKANSHAGHDRYACGTCHNATVAVGSSVTSTSLHVNKRYDLRPSTGVTFTYAFAAGGGSCSLGACHSNVQPDGGTGLPTTYAVATWGNAPSAACGTCHGNPPATGGHPLHPGITGCSPCHYGAGAGTVQHGDGNIDVVIDPVPPGNESATYSQGGPGNNPPGNGYGTCSINSCHVSERTW